MSKTETAVSKTPGKGRLRHVQLKKAKVKLHNTTNVKNYIFKITLGP
jgi:hypothetical protein